MKEHKRNRRKTKITRRELLGGAASFAAFTIVPRHVLAGSGQMAPSDTLNMGKIGCGGMQGGGDLRSVSNCEGVNIYSLCDVDEAQAGSSFSQYYQNAKLYKDFRQMLEREKDNLDGVVVTIPDHMHAIASIMAMERGIGVYTQKPLVQSVWEARLLKNGYEKYQVPTQMGNQGYSAEATRIAAEFVWNGDLGDVTEVYSWRSRRFADGIVEWPPEEPVPSTLDWDLWLGRAHENTYSSQIHPSEWRGFLEYGTQMIGDWGIHMLGPANWALGLSHTHPVAVTCTEVSGVNPVTYPSYSCIYEFPERDHPYIDGQRMAPVKVYWYEGDTARNVVLPESLEGLNTSGYNEIIIGTKGSIGTGGRGESIGVISLETTERPPEMIERSPGHFQDWVNSFRDAEPSCSNFSIAAGYTEWMLLGAISWRFPEERLEWDGENLRFTNNDRANQYVKPYFRPGWELEDVTV
ncbi:Gfo/Idh/MocA family protein [Planctomycetota bacterium]